MICKLINITPSLQLFNSPYALKEHYVQSPRHAYCQYCDKHLKDKVALRQHFTWEHHLCESCDKVCRECWLVCGAFSLTISHP